MSAQSDGQKVELTDKQKMFVEEYLISRNATQAAIKAGYSKKTARQLGSDTLSKAYIQEYIQARLKEKQLTADDVLTMLAEQAHGSMADFITPAGRGFRIDLTKARDAGKLHLLKSLSKGKQGTRIELYDAQAALVHIGKHLKLFTEVQEHRGQIEVVDHDRLDRAVSTLADALREAVSGPATGAAGNVDAAEQAPVAGVSVEGG